MARWLKAIFFGIRGRANASKRFCPQFFAAALFISTHLPMIFKISQFPDSNWDILLFSVRFIQKSSGSVVRFLSWFAGRENKCERIYELCQFKITGRF
jgi:hypothetical protein